MNKHQLRYFDAVFEHRNLSRAAAACHVAASAVSHHVSELESELGVTLFERHRKGMTPTAAAMRLHDHARDILQRFEAAAEDVRGFATEVSGRLAIGLPYTVVRAVGEALMQRVLRDYPRLRIALLETRSGAVEQSLTTGAVDIGLFYNPGAGVAAGGGQIRSEALLRETLYCVGRPAIIGTSTRPLRFAAVERLPQAVSSRAVTRREDLWRRLRAAAVMEINSITAMRTALEQGLCCAVLPTITVRDLLQDGQVHARRVIDPVITRDLHIGVRIERVPSAASETIHALLRRLVGEEVSAGRWPCRLLATDLAA